MERSHFKPQLTALPAKPGVYFFKDRAGKVLYVGKASSLRHRVRSYFGAPSALQPKTATLVAEADDLDFIVTDSEQEAIILENNLIKKHHPPYNVNLRDDKSFPYIKVCLNEDWPRVFATRRWNDDGARYFGPYASARSVRRTLSLLKRLFKYCSPRSPITGTKARPCFEYHIHRCAGACSGEISKEEYRQSIDRVLLFLEGRHDAVIRGLRKRMGEAARALEFEKAASLRDQIDAIERVSEEQKIVSPAGGDRDVIGFSVEHNHGCALVLSIRGGRLIGKEQFALEGTADEEMGKILGSFVQQYYGQASYVPQEILLQTEPRDGEVISSWLASRRGGRVSASVPKRGEKRKLVLLAVENAAQGVAQMRAKWLADSGRTGISLKELAQWLDLGSPPRRVECYDVSNVRGTSAVGSMAVFENGRPKPSEYRRFKIGTVAGIDDYAMMQEVLRRRFKKFQEGDGSSWTARPDLVVIDGGKGHLTAALRALGELGVAGIPVASLAKENEDVFLPGQTHPLRLPRDSQALYMLQRIRDEAHRFAISYHSKVRRKTSVSSALDVPGVGPKRKRVLMRRFGSIRAIRAASVDDIAAVPGITRSVAERLKEHL